MSYLIQPYAAARGRARGNFRGAGTQLSSLYNGRLQLPGEQGVRAAGEDVLTVQVWHGVLTGITARQSGHPRSSAG